MGSRLHRQAAAQEGGQHCPRLGPESRAPWAQCSVLWPPHTGLRQVASAVHCCALIPRGRCPVPCDTQEAHPTQCSVRKGLTVESHGAGEASRARPECTRGSEGGGGDRQQGRAASPSMLVLDPHQGVCKYPPSHTFFSYLWERLLSWWGCDGHRIIRPQEC